MAENKELYNAILKLETVDECEDFFADLFTMKELEAFNQRIEAARLLIEGKTYEEVIKKVNISSATLSRVSRCVQYGKGYKKILKK